MKVGSLVWALLLGILTLPPRFASAATNIYFTRFEATEGYDPAYELIGQKGWTTDSASLGGNGLITNFVGTQAAYIGLWPLNPPAESLSLWQPIYFAPQAQRLELIKFSVRVDLVSSTNGKEDDFFWNVYNSRSDRLFTIDFYNGDRTIYYALDGTNQLLSTGVIYTNDTVYTLQLAIDYALQVWSATLNGNLVVTNKPLTTTGAFLDLGDIDAIWVPAVPNAPGDNFMIFDDYQISAEPSPAANARLTPYGRTSSGQFLLRLSGPSGLRYAIEGTTNLLNWVALKTNIVTDGSFDFVDPGASPLSQRFYRGRLVP